MSRKLTIELIVQESINKIISNLSTLNISGKNITDISILSKFPSLENITLSKNQIKDLSAFKNLKNIKNLNLKENKIIDFNQLESLKNCKQLEFLCLKDNPISKDPNYLQKIKEILPQLKKIDDIEINKQLNNKDIKISIKADNKKIDKLNMITNKFLKMKNAKNKNNNSPFHANAFLGSPIRQNKQKVNNSGINKINSSGKKENKDNKDTKEKKKQILNNANNTNNNDNNNNNSDKKNYNVKKVENSDKKQNNNNKNEIKDNAFNNDDDNFEVMKINDEKKKIEDELKNEENNKPKKNKELLSYSFKKKKTGGTFYKFSKKNKNNNIDANATLDNIKIDNQLINTFNDENKNLNYSISNSRYSRKIIGKFPGGHSLLSQSIRYDDENDEENNDMNFTQKNKLYSIKNRLFNKLTNQIYNKKINSNNNIIKDKNKEKEKEIDYEKENEKMIIKSIKLLLSNLNEEELNQVNIDVINALSKNNK
jgi:hypothetical protein